MRISRGMDSDRRTLSIGDLAERTGLAPSAIRFYESKGLVTPERTGGGQRRFSRADVRRLSFVLITQRLGFTLARIRELLETLPTAANPTRRDWERLARGFRDELDERIDGLVALRARLSSCIGCGCLSLRECRIVNPDDEAHSNGPGPRFLVGDEPAGN